MANKKKVEPTESVVAAEVEEVKVENDYEAFISRKLKAINAMQKPAKAEKLASRVLRKARN